MKVLNVMLTTRLGGLEQAFLDYTAMMEYAGHNVIQILHKRSPLTNVSKGSFYRIENFSKYDPITYFGLCSIVKNTKPNLIITHGNRAHYLMTKVSAKKIPVVGVGHVYSFDYIKKCDYIISVSHDIRKHLIKLGYNHNKIVHIPNMITLPPNYNYKPITFRVPPTIGIIGRLVKDKGVELFVRAIFQLRQHGIIANGIIAGDGAEYNNIKSLISKLNLESNITMLGWVEDKEQFYKSIDILCIPSLVESFGLVILEGFIYSKPVIVSNLPGPMEIVEDGVDALVFPAGDSCELSKAIKMLLSSPNLAETIARNGFQKVKAYGLSNISKQLTDFLANIASLRGGKYI